MKTLLPLLVCLFLVACAPATPDAALVETAIAQTQAAAPTVTPAPTATPAPCLDQPTRTQLDALLARYDDAYTLAENTPRMQLAAIIADLQAVQRDAAALAVPACLAGYPALLDAMEAALTGFTAFLVDEPFEAAMAASVTSRAAFEVDYRRVSIEDGLLLGTLTPAPADALTITTQPDRVLTVVTLTNTTANPLVYLLGQLVHRNADGTTTTLAPFTFSSLAPGESTTVEFSRTQAQIDAGITYEGITVEITEMYAQIK